MAKSLIRLHQEIERQKPLYKAMKRLHNWYVEHPVTRAHIASRISELHERVETEQQTLDKKHAAELLPLLEMVKKAQDEAKAMGLKHRQEKEDMTMAFALCELDLLQEKLTEVPDHLKPIDSRPGKIVSGLSRFARWLRETFTRPARLKVVNSEARP